MLSVAPGWDPWVCSWQGDHGLFSQNPASVWEASYNRGLLMLLFFNQRRYRPNWRTLTLICWKSVKLMGVKSMGAKLPFQRLFQQSVKHKFCSFEQQKTTSQELFLEKRRPRLRTALQVNPSLQLRWFLDFLTKPSFPGSKVGLHVLIRKNSSLLSKPWVGVGG